MQIPIQLVVPLHMMKAVETRALIDSGASISYIDWGFVRKQRIPTQRLKTPIQARNADNSVNSKGVIRFTTTLITNLPISSGFDSLLVMGDHGLTKGVILCPTKKSITAEGIASLFFHKVFLRFGLFDKVISDRGPQFTSSFAQELGKLLHYDLSLSTAYHPQSDGETEQVNQEVETC